MGKKAAVDVCGICAGMGADFLEIDHARSVATGYLIKQERNRRKRIPPPS